MVHTTAHYRPPRAKVYETEADRLREQQAAEEVARRYGLHCRPTKKFFYVDYVLFDDNRCLRGFIEVKSVNHAFGQYQDYKISAAKLYHVFSIGQWYNRPAYLVVQFTNALCVLDVNDDTLGRRLGFIGLWGRKDRPQDHGQQEAAAGIPLNLFTQLT